MGFLDYMATKVEFSNRTPSLKNLKNGQYVYAKILIPWHDSPTHRDLAKHLQNGLQCHQSKLSTKSISKRASLVRVWVFSVILVKGRGRSSLRINSGRKKATIARGSTTRGNKIGYNILPQNCLIWPFSIDISLQCLLLTMK